MIAACGTHVLEPIPETDFATFDFGILTDYMMPGKANQAPFDWCMVCPLPAFFRCAKQTEMEGMDVGGDETKGCGLLLCETCASILTVELGGSLAALISKLKVERAGDGFGFRADAEYLHPQGELLRRMAAL